MEAAIDINKPVLIHSTAWLDERTLEIGIQSGEARLATCWDVDTAGGIAVINPTPETRRVLGTAASLAPRTFVGPIERRLAQGAELDLPIRVDVKEDGRNRQVEAVDLLTRCYASLLVKDLRALNTPPNSSSTGR